jgi:hypothetical protein
MVTSLPDIPADAETLAEGVSGVVVRLSATMVAKIVKQSTDLEGTLAQRAYRLCPDHVIRIFGVRRLAKGSAAIYMENLETWSTLTQWARVSQPDRAAIAALGHTLLRVLTTLHANNLFHRDLHPDNIMIDPETRRVKLIDFGLSCQGSPCRMTFGGHPVYMHPDMLRRLVDVNGQFMVERSGLTRASWRAHDMWGLGMTLVAMLEGGVHPFLPEFDKVGAVKALYTNSITRRHVERLLARWNTELGQLLGDRWKGHLVTMGKGHQGD